MVVSWAWFWWVLAAGPESAAHAIAVIAVVASAVVMVVANPAGVFPFYYAVIVAGVAFRWPIGVVLVSITTILTVATWAVVNDSTPSFQIALVTALFGGAAITVRRYVAAQLALSQTQDELRRLATRQARLDLARDLHDQLGQELTVSVLQAELLVLDVADSPPVVRDRAARVLQSTRSALELMRETVSDVRTPALTTELEAADTLLRAAGVGCTVSQHVTIRSPRAETILGWVVREGMTNVLRHSGATTCQVTITADQGEYVLCIEDDGAGRGSSEPGSGLVNMRQRLTQAGGTLDAQPRANGGFQLTARIPENT
jgi:two-component system sensor histidine kinase DesK